MAVLDAGPTLVESTHPDNLFRNTQFLRLWLGQTVSSVGSGIVKLAAPLLVLALDESTTLAGLVVGAMWFPMVILGLPAGALIDRLDRRRVMVWCEIVRATAVFSVPVAWGLGLLNAWHLLAVALALGSGQSFYNVAQVAALPRVVARRQIAAAQSLNTTSEGVSQLASPGLGGLIVGAASTAVVGGVIAYGVNGLTFLVSIFALSGIRTPFQATRTKGEQTALLRSIGEGLRYVWNERGVRLLMMLNCVHRFFFAPVMLTVVVIARQVFELDPASIGLLFSAAGSGGLTAAAVTPWLRRRIPVGWHMIGIVTGHGLALLVVALASTVWLTALGLFVAGLLETMTGITQVSFRLALIPDAFQGRVNSVYRLLSFGAMSSGTVAAGICIDQFGATVVMLAIALSIVVVGAASGFTDIRTIRD
ncbi:MAG: MFS transporter [Chloroflexota bacterium]